MLRKTASAAIAVIALATLGASVGARAPRIDAERWLNTKPLSSEDLRGAVTLVEFWTFACWNCRNVEPHIRDWHERYGRSGLRVVAVHTPELEIERDVDNVRRYLDEHHITYPVAIDNDFAIWRAFDVHAWPTLFLIGRDGRVRYRHVGEGAYEATEAKIKALLAEKEVETR